MVAFLYATLKIKDEDGEDGEMVLLAGSLLVKSFPNGLNGGNRFFFLGELLSNS